MSTVVIKGFDNDETATEFAEWLSGSGEQDFDYWAEARREEGMDCKDISVVSTEKVNVYNEVLVNVECR